VNDYLQGRGEIAKELARGCRRAFSQRRRKVESPMGPEMELFSTSFGTYVH